jgi:predicted N-acetyltransferase YhbS
MILFDTETPADAGDRDVLLDRAFGRDRFAKASERLREGRLCAEGLALVARADEPVLFGSPKPAELVATVRLWHIALGGGGGEGDGRPALLLGPLAVDERRRGEGVGSRLMRLALAHAACRGHKAVVLVGDPEYYERFGFAERLAAGLDLPGSYERRRLLGMEIVPGALDGAAGLVRPTGALVMPRPARPAEPMAAPALALAG